MKLKILDRFGLKAVAHFCRSSVKTSLKEFLLITLSLQILSAALSLQINFQPDLLQVIQWQRILLKY
jgi:hypothetical protein